MLVPRRSRLTEPLARSCVNGYASPVVSRLASLAQLELADLLAEHHESDYEEILDLANIRVGTTRHDRTIKQQFSDLLRRASKKDTYNDFLRDLYNRYDDVPAVTEAVIKLARLRSPNYSQFIDSCSHLSAYLDSFEEPRHLDAKTITGIGNALKRVREFRDYWRRLYEDVIQRESAWGIGLTADQVALLSDRVDQVREALQYYLELRDFVEENPLAATMSLGKRSPMQESIAAMSALGDRIQELASLPAVTMEP